MPYGSGGKYWNLGLSDRNRLPATRRQHFYLQKLTGIDHRGRGLTVAQASDLIDDALLERSRRQASLTKVGEQLFAAIYQRAVEAANKAGEMWLEQNPETKFVVHDPETGENIGVHGEIGIAWITWPKRGSDLYKWLMENLYDGQNKVFHIPHRYEDRLEGGLQLACTKAAYDVFRKSGTSIGDIRLMYRAEEALPQAA